MSVVWRSRLFLLLSLHCLSSYALSESANGNVDLLADEWADFSTGPHLGSSETESSWVDYLTLKLKTDIAYADQLSFARSSVRFLSEGAPTEGFYLKADVQFSYFNRYDDLLISEEKDEYAGKVNDLWAQYTLDSCNLKAGQYTAFWGAVEGTNALDVIAPLDLSEPLLTDFSQIRRSQFIVGSTCFVNAMEWEVLVIPDPLLDQYTYKQTQDIRDLEKAISAEWGSRFTYHATGTDYTFFLGRFYENTPSPVVNLFSGNIDAYEVSQFDFVGIGIVHALDRLLIELDVSYRTWHKSQFIGQLPSVQFLDRKTEYEQFHAALGLEYTTASNHQFSIGYWLYDYLTLISFEKEQGYALNTSWSKQFLNDDLTLSTLGFWQNEPERYQLTFLAEYLVNDHWSYSAAISYQHQKNASASTVMIGSTEPWTLFLSALYVF